MIVFDLRCSKTHVFEAWFGSSRAFENQQESGLLACPICGDRTVTKAVMTPNVGAKGNSRSAVAVTKPDSPAQPTPQAIKAALHALASAQAQMLETSQWVGRGFADQARAMHVGETASTPIHGETTVAEAKALIDDGVPIAALPLPVVPPRSVN